MTKEYTTSEMIAMLERDPKLKFEDEKGFITTMDEARRVVTYHKSNPNDISYCMFIDDKWTLVREPVTWQEALQAWCEGKTIRSFVNKNIEDKSDDNSGRYAGMSGNLIDALGRGITKHEIGEAVWIIEED